jgi:NAD-dependent deacetylase
MSMQIRAPETTIPSELIKVLRSSNHVTVLTGAGVSKESGLRTFRDAMDGLWAEHRPEELATPEAFKRNPELVWEFYETRRLKAREVKPNAGHIALAEMERHLPGLTVITQNVDGLHRRAGSKNVVELHGNILRVKCSRGCGVIIKWEEVPGIMPTCPTCGENLRPDVVWFGEMLPGYELANAIQAAETCTVFFSIGTSGLVQPAATLPFLAKQSGAVIVEINTEETPLTPSANHLLRGKFGEIMPGLVKEVWF